MKHNGRAVVFENIEDFHERIDDPKLDIDESCVMVLKNCGPKGYPGMAEVGNMPLPPKLLKKGVTDMVRISDARMSGTAYGTVVLHVRPRRRPAARWRWCENGDMIELDVAEAAGCSCWFPTKELAAAQEELEDAQAAAAARLLAALLRPRAAGRRGRRPRLPGGQERRVRAARQPLSEPGAGARPRQRTAQFHVEDEAVDLSATARRTGSPSASSGCLAAVVFYQFFTRYVLNDSAAWTEEIARYLLIAWCSSARRSALRKNNHIQVDFFYRLMPRGDGARAVDPGRRACACLFFGYAVWLTWLMMQRIGNQRMTIVDLPMNSSTASCLFGFAADVPALAAGRLAPLAARLQRARAARVRRRSGLKHGH